MSIWEKTSNLSSQGQASLRAANQFLQVFHVRATAPLRRAVPLLAVQLQCGEGGGEALQLLALAMPQGLER